MNPILHIKLFFYFKVVKYLKSGVIVFRTMNRRGLLVSFLTAICAHGSANPITAFKDRWESGKAGSDSGKEKNNRAFVKLEGLDAVFDYDFSEPKHDDDTNEIIVSVRNIGVDYLVSAAKSQEEKAIREEFNLAFRKVVTYLATKKEFLRYFEYHDPKDQQEQEAVIRKCFLKKNLLFTSYFEDVNGKMVQQYALQDILIKSKGKIEQRDFGSSEFDLIVLGRNLIQIHNFQNVIMDYAGMTSDGILFLDSDNLIKLGKRYFAFLEKSRVGELENLNSKIIFREFSEMQKRGLEKFVNYFYRENAYDAVMRFGSIGLYSERLVEKIKNVPNDKTHLVRQKAELFTVLLQTIGSGIPHYALVNHLISREEDSLLKQKIYTSVLEILGKKKLKKKVDVKHIRETEQEFLGILAGFDKITLYRLCEKVFDDYKDKFFDLSQ